MPNLVNLENVAIAFGGPKPVLDGVSLGVERGDRIGVVGSNGGGKSTLVSIMAGRLEPDAGRVSPVRGLRMASVTQQSQPSGATVRSSVLGGEIPDHEWAAEPRSRTVIEGLRPGGGRGLDASVEGLSGGERQRIALAAALVGDLDLLVLDEPTNHLDVEGVRWLAEHLLARRAALVVVTHDRWFLDTVASRTWEVVDGHVEQYEGGYNDWIFARAERARLADAAEARRRNLARKELAWLRRGPQARTSKPRYRVEAAEALIADVPEPRDSVELVTMARHRLGRTVVELEDATLTVGRAGGSAAPPRTIVDRQTWRIGPGDRVGIVGVNGSGKTTLLEAVAGERDLDGGKRTEGTTVRMAHLSQDVVRASGATGVDLALPRDRRVLQAVEDIAERVWIGGREHTASALAERFGFPASRQWTPVSDLSGGERRRLQLVRLLMTEPNVLLLDEPTNDLDVDTLQQLEDILDNWAGTLVVVSHDRYLTERICDRVVALFGDGRITDLPGGIEEYLRRRDQQVETAGAAASSSSSREGSPRADRAATSSPREAAPPGRSEADRRAARKEAGRIERRLEKLDTREKQLHTELADAATEPGRLLELDGEYRALRSERVELEEAWLEASVD